MGQTALLYFWVCSLACLTRISTTSPQANGNTWYLSELWCAISQKYAVDQFSQQDIDGATRGRQVSGKTLPGMLGLHRHCFSMQISMHYCISRDI